jgi:hypothetical protein
MTRKTHREGVAGRLARMCVIESSGIPHDVVTAKEGGITTGAIFGLTRDSATLWHSLHVVPWTYEVHGHDHKEGENGTPRQTS